MTPSVTPNPIQFIHCTPNAEALIVDMARVSNPAGQGKPGERLLAYLIKHGHWSPFEMGSLCVKITTERDISAQILRHRSFSFQEYSTRYAKAPAAVVPRLRRQDTENRQNSIDDLSPIVAATYDLRISNVFWKLHELYEDMIEMGIAKECARRILPLSTQTTLYMHGTLRSWIHYLQVRCSPETQLEHREIAEGCKAIFAEQFPVIASAVFTKPEPTP